MRNGWALAGNYCTLLADKVTINLTTGLVLPAKNRKKTKLNTHLHLTSPISSQSPERSSGQRVSIQTSLIVSGRLTPEVPLKWHCSFTNQLLPNTALLLLIAGPTNTTGQLVWWTAHAEVQVCGIQDVCSYVKSHMHIYTCHIPWSAVCSA